MRVSDIVGSLDVALLPVIGMLVFVVAFCTIVVRAFLTDRRSIDHAADIPLEEENSAPLFSNADQAERAPQ